MQHAGGIIGLCLWHCMIAGALKICPLTVETWNTASMALQCQPPNYYHCIRDENGRITQQCLQRVWIQPGMCPEFNAEAQRIDVYSCKSNKDDCPTATFWSNAIYVYPGCFFNASSTTLRPVIVFPDSTTEISRTDTSTKAQASDNTTTIVIAVCIALLVLIALAGACIVGVVVIRRKRRADSSGEELENNINSQQSETVNMLDSPGEEMIDTQPNEVQKMLDSSPDRRREILNNTHQPRTETSRMLDSSPDRRREILNNTHQPRTETSRMLDDFGKMESEDNSINLDKQLTVHCNRLKEKYADVRICFFVSHTHVSDRKIEEASEIMKEKIVKENDYDMWKTIKWKSMYIFRDWVNTDQENCVDEIKRTLVEVLQAAVERETKFVIVFPLSVWSKDIVIQQLRSNPSCKIRY